MFENIMQTRMAEGATVFVNTKTQEIFLVMQNYDWEGQASYVSKEDIEKWKRYIGLEPLEELGDYIFYEDDDVTLYFLDA